MILNSFLVALGLLNIAISPAAAFWRLPCQSPVLVTRGDPIVTPGEVSGHLHTIMGGNGFDFTMDYAQTQRSTCSSCTVIGDMSNYWVPTLWYQGSNGTFTSVDQSGGALVYYLQRYGNNASEPLHAFPEGFRMVAGNPFKRSYGGDLASQAISYACLNFSGPATAETPGFPTTNCPSGLRSQVFFPSCWDGVNLDSPNHSSHMAYPSGMNTGTCPSSHPVRLISIFYEVTWQVDAFKDMWYDGTFPFVWAMGDPTGYGFHGDFINGWNVPHLQDAINTCTASSGRVEDCPVFDLVPSSEAQDCQLPPRIDEPTSGLLPALPGCNPVQYGPDPAIPLSNCSTTSYIGDPTIDYFTDLTSTKGWSYLGCGIDNYTARVLSAARITKSSMTLESCINFCSGNGYTIAGAEYSQECYCGNTLPEAALPLPGLVGGCDMTCAGNSSEFCGGALALSLYQKCSGSTCTNADLGLPDSSSQWTSLGCYKDPTVAPITKSIYPYTKYATDSMTIGLCQTYCLGLDKSYVYAGVEYGRECYCGTKTSLQASAIPNWTGCTKQCKGNDVEYCGGSNAMYVYEYVDSTANSTTSTTTSTTSSVISTNSSSSTKLTTTSTGSSTQNATIVSTSSSSQSSTKSITTSSKAITTSTFNSTSTSTKLNSTSTLSSSTLSTSTSASFDPSATSNTSSSKALSSSNTTATSTPGSILPTPSTNSSSTSTSKVSSTTSAPADSDPTDTSPSSDPSAGPSPSVNSTSATSTSKSVLTTSVSGNINITLPAGWQAAGCYSDNITPRSLRYWSPLSGNQVNNTRCSIYCDSVGFAVSGTENGGQCFCDYNIYNSTLLDSTKCNVPCKGDVSQICGASRILSVFTKLNGTLATGSTSQRKRHLDKHRKFGGL